MPKKILLVYAKSSLELLDRKSALGSYIFCLCELLQKDNTQLFVNGIAFNQLKKQPSVVKSQAQSGSKIYRKYIPKFLKEAIKDMLIFKNLTQLYKQIILSEKYDCVLEFYNYASNLGSKIANQQNIPLIVVYDAPVLEEYVFFHGPKYFFRNKIMKRELETLKRANSIVAYSDAVKNYLNKIVGKELNIFIHQNVDFTRFEYVENKTMVDTINIGFIGSFLKWHRVDILVNAFTKLKEEGLNVKLFLLGNGMEHEIIKRQVKENKYSADIEMPGFIDGNQLFEYKKKLHIGVMPGSNWYGAPNKIFEYGAAKMAVVAPDTPTIKSLFNHDEELLLFKQDNENDLLDKLLVYINNIELLNKHAQALQLKIKNKYSESITFDFYDQLLR